MGYYKSMLILTIRTDNPQAEVGLYNDHDQLGSEKWQAHRELSETIHTKLKTLLDAAKKQWTDVDGIVVYQGPGSFTGLRIGVSVANALAAANTCSVVGSTGDDWIEQGLQRSTNGESDKVVLPEYGAPVHITQQKR